MKKLSLATVVSFALVMTACNKANTKKDSNSVDAKEVEESKLIAPEVHKELYGIYTGIFSPIPEDASHPDAQKLLTIKINRITKDSVYGQSIVDGNQQNFRGIYNENTHHFVLDEPGNQNTDGRFELAAKDDSLTGKWTVYKNNAVQYFQKAVRVKRREFVYNPNLMPVDFERLFHWETPKTVKEKYVDPDTNETDIYDVEQYRVLTNIATKYNSSKQKLTEKDLKNATKLDLQILKNSIFARHGYAFKKETYRNYFEESDWYVPVTDNVDAELTPLEKQNIELLNRFITYAEDKYDSFSR